MGHFLSRVDSSLQLGKVLFSRYVTRSVVRIQWHEFSQCLQCCVACSESFVVTFWTGNRTTDYIVSVFLYGTYKHLCGRRNRWFSCIASKYVSIFLRWRYFNILYGAYINLYLYIKYKKILVYSLHSAYSELVSRQSIYLTEVKSSK